MIRLIQSNINHLHLDIEQTFVLSTSSYREICNHKATDAKFLLKSKNYKSVDQCRSQKGQGKTIESRVPYEVRQTNIINRRRRNVAIEYRDAWKLKWSCLSYSEGFKWQLKLTCRHINRRHICFNIKSISVHPLLWMNVMLGFICMFFVGMWTTFR